MEKDGLGKDPKGFDPGYKNMLDNMLEGCAIIDYSWNYIYVNEAYAKHVHQPAERLIHANLLEIFPEVEDTFFFEGFKKVMEERVPQRIEGPFTFSNGETCWYQTSVQPVPEGISLLSLDITEKEKTKRELEVSQQLLQSTLDNFPTVIAFKDKEGRFIKVNKVVEKILGIPKEKIIGLTDYDITPKEYADKYRQFDLEVMRTRRPIQREEITELASGTIHHLDISFPLIDSENNVYGVGHISNDITDIKKAEEEIRKNQKILMLILNHINEGIIVSNAPDGKVSAISRWGINHTLGQSIDSVLDIPIEKYLEQWDVREIESGEKTSPEKLPVARALQGEIIQGEEWKMVRPDGTSFITSVNAVPICSPDTNEVISAVATWSDITDRKRFEEELIATKENLQERLREKDVLLKELYHRTKNNMQVISSLLGLKSSTLDDPQAEEVFDNMQSRIRSIALVHEKLYQSQNLSRVNLREYIYDLVGLLFKSHSVRPDKIFAKYDLDEITVLLDMAVPIGLIITELILNSLKYAFPGDRKGYIRISLRQKSENTIELKVSDNGTGFDPAAQTGEHKLGINLIKGIAIDQLGGQVKLDTSSGVSWSIKFKDDFYSERV